MSDAARTFCANVSELCRELRTAAGTVLTTLGSRLEADARAQVECGPQWLTEFEKQRDSLEPRAVCELHGAWCAFDPSCGNHLKGSAAVSAAADPSPARPSPSPASAVDEGSGGDSDILPSPPPERSTVPIRWRVGTSYQPRCGACGCDVAGLFPNQIAAERAVSDKGGRCNACFAYLDLEPVTPVVAGESPREESGNPPTPPSLGDLTVHDLAHALAASCGLDPALIDARLDQVEIERLARMSDSELLTRAATAADLAARRSTTVIEANELLNLADALRDRASQFAALENVYDTQ
ncbi:hypothetical protein [Mycobacterium sp. 48b]|uniref:hypothetical protein n=1 Tax=Mycobacterium sp. 48b TaxID=3400426 RepID=UPI003AAAE28A